MHNVKDPFKYEITRYDPQDEINKEALLHKYTTVYKCCCGRHPTLLEPKKETKEFCLNDRKYSYNCTCGWCNLTDKEEKEQENVELHEYCIKYCCCGGKCKTNEPGAYFFLLKYRNTPNFRPDRLLN